MTLCENFGPLVSFGASVTCWHGNRGAIRWMCKSQKNALVRIKRKSHSYGVLHTTKKVFLKTWTHNLYLTQSLPPTILSLMSFWSTPCSQLDRRGSIWRLCPWMGILALIMTFLITNVIYFVRCSFNNVETWMFKARKKNSMPSSSSLHIKHHNEYNSRLGLILDWMHG